MSERISSYEEFWPYYLHEHRNPASRWLHFVGTTGWMTACAASAVRAPVRFSAAMAAFAAVATHGTKDGEKVGPAYLHCAAMLAIPALASPVLYPAGVTFAYACAWAGHFGIEGNRPATFQYPLWSFVSDIRMWTHMARGQLWTGDPLEELGLRVPSAVEKVEAHKPESVPVHIPGAPPADPSVQA